jgi:predicted homoserine dehydrogenase-like protein
LRKQLFKMNQLDKFKTFVEDRSEHVKVGLVGAGQMGQGIVAQVSKMYGVDLVCIIDRNQKQLDIASERYKKYKENQIVCSDSISALDNVELDIVIEATGTPAAGAIVAKNVLNRGINLILLNVETEATIGLALRKEAEKNNAIVTVADGDEPVAALELYNFATELSFEVVSIGKGKNNPFDTFATPGSLKKEASLKKMNPKMLTSFVDGTKTMVEMTALANFLDFNLDIDGMHGIEATYENLNQYYIPKQHGGLLDNSQVVDFAFGIAPGVFVVIHSEDDYVNYEMEYLKMGKGPYWTLARPYHLTSLEIPRTIRHIMLDKYSKLSAQSWNVEVVAYAKQDIEPGTNLGSIGGDYIYGTAQKTASSKGLLPIGIAEDNIATKSIEKGNPISIGDVDAQDNELCEYWNYQNRILDSD